MQPISLLNVDMKFNSKALGCRLKNSISNIYTLYFQLERRIRKGDPIAAYLFILAEVIFALINANPNNEGLPFFSYNFLYSAYVKLINTADMSSLFSGLKINKEKCQIAGIGVKKG